MVAIYLRQFRQIFFFMIVTSISGCFSFDSSVVQARPESPEPTRVDAVAIALVEDQPQFVIAVEPVSLAPALRETFGSTVESGQGGARRDVRVNRTGNREATVNTVADDRREATRTTAFYEAQRDVIVDERAIRVSSQFISALSGVENFSVRDYPSIVQQKGGLYGARIGPNEVGPFIVRAFMTEFGTRIEFNSEEARYFPLAKTKNSREVGVVALDIQIVDGRSGTIVKSFPSYGRFEERAKELDLGVILPLYEREASARSLEDQALRVALNSAAKEIYLTLASLGK